MKILVSEEILYQETESTFSHDGNTYDINKVFAITDYYRVEDIKVKDLEWNLQFSDNDKARSAKSDYHIPIIVTPWEGRLVVLDGLHRLVKAKKEKSPTIAAKTITKEALKAAIIE